MGKSVDWRSFHNPVTSLVLVLVVPSPSFVLALLPSPSITILPSSSLKSLIAIPSISWLPSPPPDPSPWNFVSCITGFLCPEDPPEPSPQHIIIIIININIIQPKVKVSCSVEQCLGSVGSARFWLPGSGSAKTCGSTNPDPRGKISTKNCKKKLITLKPKFEKKDYKNFLISEWFIKF